MTKYKRLVILTGAGISAESGIKTFRASDGLWEGHRVEDVASPEGFARNPILVQQFYNERRALLNSGTVQPNRAHCALANLAQQFSGEVLLVTQNIDNLHERGGVNSNQLVHMHGELNKVRCLNSGQVYEWKQSITGAEQCVCCQQAGTLRPHIVWFGELPMELERIYSALLRCDLFMAIGTSGHVFPAAGFVQLAAEAGAHTVELNLDRSLVNNQFNESIQGAATRIVPDYVAGLLV